MSRKSKGMYYSVWRGKVEEYIDELYQQLGMDVGETLISIGDKQDDDITFYEMYRNYMYSRLGTRSQKRVWNYVPSEKRFKQQLNRIRNYARRIHARSRYIIQVTNSELRKQSVQKDDFSKEVIQEIERINKRYYYESLHPKSRYNQSLANSRLRNGYIRIKKAEREIQGGLTKDEQEHVKKWAETILRLDSQIAQVVGGEIVSNFITQLGKFFMESPGRYKIKQVIPVGRGNYFVLDMTYGDKIIIGATKTIVLNPELNVRQQYEVISPTIDRYIKNEQTMVMRLFDMLIGRVGRGEQAHRRIQSVYTILMEEPKIYDNGKSTGKTKLEPEPQKWAVKVTNKETRLTTYILPNYIIEQSLNQDGLMQIRELYNRNTMTNGEAFNRSRLGGLKSRRLGKEKYFPYDDLRIEMLMILYRDATKLSGKVKQLENQKEIAQV